MLAVVALYAPILQLAGRIHGESDHVSGNATSAADLAAWQADYEADARAATGQTEPVPFFHTRMSGWTRYDSATSAMPLQQLQASVA